MLVAIVRIPAPPTPEAAGLESRFAASLAHVQHAPGFAGFELLRPAGGSGHYLSISRWQSRADFDAWAGSAANAAAHGRPTHDQSPAPAQSGPPAGVELYEVCDL